MSPIAPGVQASTLAALNIIVELSVHGLRRCVGLKRGKVRLSGSLLGEDR